MPNDCGSKKEKRNQIWVYKKTCDKNPNLPINSYVGKTGFAYYLVNKDTKEATEFKVDYKFSNSIPGEIVYYVRLYKVVKTKFNKKKNTIKKYLECFTQYSYITKLEQSRITNIIIRLSNGNYDLTPHEPNEFNNNVIQNILKTNKSSKNKDTTNSITVNTIVVPKTYGRTTCTGTVFECLNDNSFASPPPYGGYF
jgi:hypothetical protein